MATRNSNTNASTGYWEEAFYNAYTPGMKAVLQEKVDAYAGSVMVDVLEGESKAYDFVGELNLVQKNTRFEDLPLEEGVHNRRWMSPKFYRKRIFVDDEDQIALLTDPTSPYMQAFAKGIIRIKNDVIYNAFDANVRGGDNPGDDTYVLSDTVYTGVANAGRTIVHDTKNDYTVGGTSTGLTIEKLILTRQALIELYNDPNQMFNIVVGPQQMSDLLREAETQSIDTNIVRALVSGTVSEYMGFRFIVDHNVKIGSSNDIDADTNIYPCFAWAKEGVLFAQNKSPQFKVDWHVEKQVWQISARAGMNAIRMDEDAVIKIECA
jgi:hypothetical protein